MIPIVRRYIFKDAPKSSSAPHIFLSLCLYSFMVSAYTVLFFNVDELLIRGLLSIILTTSYVLFERSPLKATTSALGSAVTIFAVLVVGALLFDGDFLLFTYNIGIAMILLTYLKPKIIANYTIIVSALIGLFLFVFNVNLLGPSFTTIHNILSFMTSVGINFIIYVFCKSYKRTIGDLVKAKNDASIAAETKGTFLSTMSHEIRTPMNAIIGMTNIGLSSNAIRGKQNALTKIEDASTHLLGVINDVLDMSKIEAGKLELSSVEFIFERALKRAVNVLSLRLDEKKQDFSMHIDYMIPEVLQGDDQRLVQVLTNLLGNAVKFTPEGGSICLDAELLKIEEGICSILFHVVDSGIGISSEQQANLFHSFAQADASTSRKFGGTGLGLTITKHIVEMMVGKIWIESELGKGATFIFTIHMKKSKLQKHELITKKTNESTDISQIICRSCNILLVEDIEINREIVIALLEPTMIGIDCADNGEKAVEMFKNAPEKYDIIFMDVHMPEMDGYEATRIIRSLDAPKANNVPIIAMTANVFKEDIDKCLEAGMDDHIGKPIDFNMVLSKLKKYLFPS